jgi:hypothetical protein
LHPGGGRSTGHYSSSFRGAAVGDGAYLFANPTVCNWVAEAHRLPALTVIFNNSRYGAVRKATLSMFKDGAAGEADGRFFANLNPSPAYDAIVRAPRRSLRAGRTAGRFAGGARPRPQRGDQRRPASARQCGMPVLIGPPRPPADFYSLV